MESPFGETNGDLKYGLEFEKPEYDVIDQYCRGKKIPWFASCWDEGSIDFIAQYDVPCFKIASASLTDDELLRHYRSKGRPIIISTGMSTLEQVDHAVEVLGKTGPCDPPFLQHLSGRLFGAEPESDSLFPGTLRVPVGTRAMKRACPHLQRR